MTPYAGSVRPLGAETTRRSYGSQTAYRPRPPFGATRGRKLQCLRRQLLSSEVDGPRAQTLLDAQASAGPATHDARHGAAHDARRGAAAGSRAGHRAAAACGGAREARRRLGARRAPAPRRRRGLDAEPRQQDVRAGARPRAGLRGRRPGACAARAHRPRRAARLSVSSARKAAAVTMVALLTRTEARWARANAASSRARRAAPARGSATVDAQARSPHIWPQTAAPMSGRTQPSLPERT